MTLFTLVEATLLQSKRKVRRYRRSRPLFCLYLTRMSLPVRSTRCLR